MEFERIGFYLDVWRKVETLRQANERLRSRSGARKLLPQVRSLQSLLQEQSSNQGRARLLPFAQLRSLGDDLQQFYQMLQSELDDPAAGIGRPAAWQQQLQHLVERVEETFREEVQERLVFISPGRPGLREFLSMQEFIHDPVEWQYFLYLPQIAQRNFQDAGQCLA